MPQKLTIEEMHKIAEEREGKCLSEIYVNSKTKLLWQCARGHQWEAIPNSIKRGRWCPICSNHVKLTIEEIYRVAEEHEGQCLSDTYINNRTKLLWECAKGHQWRTTPDNVKSGKWCPHCARNVKLTINEMKKLANKRGGKCLSKEYYNSQTKLLWECAEGHQWKATPNDIKHNGRWCPYCGGTVKNSIENMHQIAEKRRGKCLSEQYVNGRTYLLWECEEGHRWKASPEAIKRGNWCPVCSSGLGERICREFFEQLFDAKFPKIWPEWLINSRGNRMELDGYCQKLGIAFEHHGQHHYSSKGFFTKTEKDFKQRQVDDKCKKELCEQRGIALIEIPEIPTLLPVGMIKEHIKKECNKLGISIPPGFNMKKVNLDKPDIKSKTKEALKELQDIAQKRGGKCLSKKYIGCTIKLLWECSKGHRWRAKAYSVKHGSWCPTCHYEDIGQAAKLTIEEMRRLASSYGGKCLSITYIDCQTKLLWECSNGHQWERSPIEVRQGKWCPECSKAERKKRYSRKKIQDMQQIAKKRGGKCLSTTYVNKKTKLLWECAEGHQWRTTPDSIKQGSWCIACAGRQKGSIGEMREIAKKKGGRCLSKEYVNSRSKLLWECLNRHQWEAVPASIKRGHWCPTCARLKNS